MGSEEAGKGHRRLRVILYPFIARVSLFFRQQTFRTYDPIGKLDAAVQEMDKLNSIVDLYHSQ